MQETWDSDPGDLMKSASDYLASKVIPAEAPEPGSDTADKLPRRVTVNRVTPV